MAYEIERKFLLAADPQLPPNDLIAQYMINQYYLTENGKPIRIRFQTEMTPPNKVTVFKTWKTRIGPEVFEEHEQEVTNEHAMKLIEDQNAVDEQALTVISKDRKLYVHKGNKWEVDTFTHIQLITAECEIVVDGSDQISEGTRRVQNIVIPSKIEKVLIKEVTGEREFSNKSLSRLKCLT